MRGDPFRRFDTTLPQVPGYAVDRVPAFRATKSYVCPGCGNTIPDRTGHVVAWPEEEIDLRRHWHLHCWRIAANRGRV